MRFNIKSIAIPTISLLLLAAGMGFAPYQTGNSFAVIQDDGKKQEIKAKIGKKAPEFTLKGSDGKTYSLSKFKGKVVILEWTNQRCADWRRIHESSLVKKAFKQVKEIDSDVVWLAINSTFDTTAKENNTWIRKYELKYPILLDNDGSVGHLYNARTTPHMFMIDKKGILVYAGAFDDDPNGVKLKRGKKVVNYVVNTLKKLDKGEVIKTEQMRPYGCRVKYKEAKKRD